MESIRSGKYRIPITNTDFVLFGSSGITKGDLIDYYDHIGSIMIPYTKNRPLTMVRYPRGIDEKGFYQKDAPDYFPSWIKRKKIAKKEDGKTTYIIANHPATLVYLANQGCITPHCWLSKIDKLHYPDKLVFDLDPAPGIGFSYVRTTALRLKELLEEVGLIPFVKTTGSRGLHVVVPIKRTVRFDRARKFTRAVAEHLVADDPKHLTLEIRKEKRGKRIFMDVLRNAFAQTAVAPYAVRPKEGAPVAAPISWDEVEDCTLISQRYTIKNIFKRLNEHGDEWDGMNKCARSIIKAENLLKQIL